MCKLNQLHREKNWLPRLVIADGRVHRNPHDGHAEYLERFE
jgi:hypothetical protein